MSPRFPHAPRRASRIRRRACDDRGMAGRCRAATDAGNKKPGLLAQAGRL
jgi:hypothetical protein